MDTEKVLRVVEILPPSPSQPELLCVLHIFCATATIKVIIFNFCASPL